MKKPALSRASLLVVIIPLLATSPAVHAAGMLLLPNDFVIYNTGIDLVSNVDQHWTMTVNPFDGSGLATLDSAGYLSANNSDSGWIGPASANLHAPEDVYRVAINIDLSNINLATFVLSGFWTSDNQGLDIIVNGNRTGQTNLGAHSMLPSAFPENAFEISAASGLVFGMNTIEFEWGNGPAGGAGSQFPNPTHVRVEFTEVDATLVPLPPANFLFTAALLTLIRRSNRQYRR